MSNEMETAIRCRNYAEELRIMAGDKATAENREMLLKVARDYDRIADSYEAIEKSKRAAWLSH